MPIRRDGTRDEVAVEEPLEIRVDGVALAVTMRTPGEDEELALGFLHGEGLIHKAHIAGPSEDLALNTVDVQGPLQREPSRRQVFTSSSCGVCGKAALEQSAVTALPAPPGPEVTPELLAHLPDKLLQPTFQRTGGLHAAGLFTPQAELVAVREDV